MTARSLRIAAGFALCLSAAPLWAHHAFVAVFDLSKQRDFKGTVTRVEWLNPHARFALDVVEPSGKTARWEFELGSPNALMQHGWTRYTLKKGRHGHRDRRSGARRFELRACPVGYFGRRRARLRLRPVQRHCMVVQPQVS